MLKNIEQLEEVYRLYGLMSSALPILQYDYSCSEMVDLGFKEFINSVNQARMPLHKLDSHTAGNLNGSLVAVGKPFKDHTDKDLWTRLPFMHTDNVFEVVLWHAGVCERDILWVPQDSNLLDIPNLSARNILARSSEAEENLLGSGLDFFTSVEKWVHHPRRFIC
jgi:hypothetical protein